MRLQFMKATCKHPIEWDKRLFNCEKIEKDYREITNAVLNESIKNKLIKESEKSDIWEKGLSKVFKKNNFYFVNPIYFLNHLENAGLFEFNPYEKETIKPRFSKGNDPSIVVTSNPGFAPAILKVVTNDDKERFIFQKSLNGVELFWATVNYDCGKTEGYGGTHSGIDLAGYEGTSIYALINGVVLDLSQ